MSPTLWKPTVEAVFTLVTRGQFLTSASKINIEPNGDIFDVSPENDRASPNVKTPLKSWPDRQMDGAMAVKFYT